MLPPHQRQIQHVARDVNQVLHVSATVFDQKSFEKKQIFQVFQTSDGPCVEGGSSQGLVQKNIRMILNAR